MQNFQSRKKELHLNMNWIFNSCIIVIQVNLQSVKAVILIVASFKKE